MIERDQLLPALLRRFAHEQPQRTFLRDVRGRSIDFATLDDTIRHWSAALASVGVEAGATVLSMLPNSIEAVQVWLGAAWLRAIEVPVNTDYRGRLLREIIEDSRARVLIVDERIWNDINKADLPAGQLETVIVASVSGVDTASSAGPVRGVGRVVAAASLLSSVARRDDLAPPEPWDLATILYTSGTTGRSKGVMVPWAQLHATVVEMWPPDVSTGDVYYSPYPPFHVGGKMPVYMEAVRGGEVVLRERFSTSEFWHDVRTFGCTTTCLLGAMASFLASQPETNEDATSPLRNVLMIPLLPNVEEFKRRFGVRVTTVFNMTELSCPIVADGWELYDNKSCGRARRGYELRLVDEHDRPVPDGTVGELVVRADEPWTLMAGYWGNPEKTAEVWRNQWLHTGDLFVRNQDGYFYYVDRLKDSIRRRGENISSFEIERAALDHPAVAECAAVAVPADVGEDEVKLVVVPRPEQRLDPAELVEFLRGQLPRFMVPRYIEVMSSLPKTPTEKVLKHVLREAGVTAGTWDAEAGRS